MINPLFTDSEYEELRNIDNDFEGGLPIGPISEDTFRELQSKYLDKKFRRMLEMNENDILIYDQIWEDIPPQDEPQAGVIFVCKCAEGWKVGVQLDVGESVNGLDELASVSLGVFQRKDLAIQFGKVANV